MQPLREQDSIKAFLDSMKRATPFLFRYGPPHHQDLTTVIGQAPVAHLDKLSFAQWAEFIINLLPAGWQLTQLPGYAILYKENQDYGSAKGYFRKNDAGKAEFIAQEQQLET